MRGDDSLVLAKATVLVMDDRDGYYPNGFVRIERGLIAEVGDATGRHFKGRVIDASGTLVMPGLVNAHTHTPSPLFRGMADDLRLMDWLNKVLWPAEKHMVAEDAYRGAALSCLEFLRSGITCFADQYFFSRSIGRAVEESGLRALLAATVFSRPSPESGDSLSRAVEFVEEYGGREGRTRIVPALGPHAPYSCDEDTLRETARQAERLGVGVHIHISETAEEGAGILEKTGKSPTAFLASTGLLDRPTLAAHCVHLSDADCDILAEKDVRVSYNPVSNLKLVSGAMPLRRLWARGIVVGIGSDGAQSNNSLDILRDAKTGALLQKHIEGDAAFFPARDIVRMLTIEGARALRMGDSIGSLEVGKRADIIALDLSGPHLRPCHRDCLPNLYSLVAYSAMGSDVRHAIVDGEFLMRDRLPLRVDSEGIIARAEESSRRILKAAGLL